MTTNNGVIVTITPKLAEAYLEKNVTNRPFNPATVKAYAQAMLNGEWRLTHQGIAFNTDGHLQDGQHRLQAVIDSNTPQQFLVYKNMPIDNFSVIDSGRGRKSTDVLYLDGVTNPIQKSTIARFVILKTLYGMGSAIASGGSIMLSNEAIRRFVNDNAAKMDEVSALTEVWYRKFPKNLEVRLIGGLYWLFSEVNKKKAKYFFDALVGGAGLAETSPILLLRNILISDSLTKKKMPRTEKVALVIKAWNYYLAGRELSSLRWSKKVDKNFPEIQQEIVSKPATELVG